MNFSVRNFQIYATALAGFWMVLTLVTSLQATDGTFIYSLDDPYIHLSLAESILAGEYGINAGEYASPSSSILYPFIMALGLTLGLGIYAPLAFAVPASLLAVWLLAGTAGKAASFDQVDNVLWPFLLLGLALVLGVNSVALPFTGMEHSIHVLGVALALSGLYRAAVLGESGGLNTALVGAVLCALIRFEGMALALAVIVGMFVLGYRRHAILAALLIGVSLTLYARTMLGFGLPILPSSVMMKSSIAADAAEANATDLIFGFIANIFASFFNRWGTLFAVVAVALVLFASFRSEVTKGTRVFCVVVAFTLFAHITAGQYGWFSRYEVYAVAAMLFGCVALLGGLTPSYFSIMGAALLGLVVAMPYLHPTFRSPAASANIYQQQYQMHRFAQEYFPARVAVNDLGYVAFGNDNYVLDLWGLGSEEARLLSRNNRWTPALLDEITQRHNISYAMIYDLWFRDVPSEWCLVGQLFTSKVTSASGIVSFYLIERTQETEMRAALEDFIPDLPQGARMETKVCSTP